MEKISWADHVKNEVLPTVREERNILPAIKRKNAHWIGHMLSGNCLLKYIIEGKIEEMRR
jgi:hypothetical protein